MNQVTFVLGNVFVFVLAHKQAITRAAQNKNAPLKGQEALFDVNGTVEVKVRLFAAGNIVTY